MVKEPQRFDSQFEQIVYRPIDNRSTPSVRTAIKTQLPKTSILSKFFFNKGQKHLQIIQRTPPESAQTDSPSPTFKIPPDYLPARPGFQSSPTRQKFNELGPNSTPTSNSAKILAGKNRRELNSKRPQAQLKYP